MAGRGGSETQSRAATRARSTRGSTRNTPIQRPAGTAPRPLGVAGDQPSGRTTTTRSMGRGVTREQLPAIRPETASGGSGNRPPTTPRNAAIPSGGTPRQIPLNLSRAPQIAGPSAASRAATATMAGAGRLIGGVGPALVIPNRGLEGGADYERRGLEQYRREAQQVIPEAPSTPSQPQPQATPQRRPQAQPQRESMSADRLNELSLAMVQGRDPTPQNTAETIAVERMKQMMNQNEMARGGMAMRPKAPKMPSVKAPMKPKAPTVKKPSMPTMSKGGMAKKGKC